MKFFAFRNADVLTSETEAKKFHYTVAYYFIEAGSPCGKKCKLQLGFKKLFVFLTSRSITGADTIY